MKIRCSWVPQGDELYTQYHDQEWGVPVYDDQKLFEFLVLEAFQAGLSWRTVLYKRENFRKAFAQFDPEIVARFDDSQIQILLNDAGIIRNNLKILREINWVGYNPKSGYYFIRGFDRIRILDGFTRRTGVEYETKGIRYFKAFCIGAIIGYLVNNQKRDKWLLERKKARSSQGSHLSSSFFPISSWVLAKILNVSLSTAHRLKTLAANEGYIQIKKQLKPMGIHVKHVNCIKKYFPEIEHKIRIQRNELFIQEVDMISHNLYYKNSKKIESL